MSDLQQYRLILEPAVTFFSSLVISGAIVAYLVQFLKADIIPVPVQKYKRTAAAILSIVATLVSIYTTSLNYAFNSVFAVVAFALGVFLVSAWTYRNVIKSSAPTQVTEVPPAATLDKAKS